MEYLKKRNILAALKELITISWGGKTGKYQYRHIQGKQRVEMVKKFYNDSKEISLVKGSVGEYGKMNIFCLYVFIQIVDQSK